MFFSIIGSAAAICDISAGNEFRSGLCVSCGSFVVAVFLGSVGIVWGGVLASLNKTADGCAFDSPWESIYRSGGQLNQYPFDRVVSWFSSRFQTSDERARISVLEVGCGAGNNLWFLARSGFRCAGIDISSSAIDFARSRLHAEGLVADLRVGCFTSLPFDDREFDVVLDRGGIACVDLETGRQAIAEVARVVRPEGVFIFSPFRDVGGLHRWQKELVGCVYDREMVMSILPERYWRITSWSRIETCNELSGEILQSLWVVEAQRLSDSLSAANFGNAV